VPFRHRVVTARQRGCPFFLHSVVPVAVLWKWKCLSLSSRQKTKRSIAMEREAKGVVVPHPCARQSVVYDIRGYFVRENKCARHRPVMSLRCHLSVLLWPHSPRGIHPDHDNCSVVRFCCSEQERNQTKTAGSQSKNLLSSLFFHLICKLTLQFCSPVSPSPYLPPVLPLLPPVTTVLRKDN
jgi:hypothetical protein